MLKTISICDAKNVMVHGRTAQCGDALTLFWSTSGLEMNLQGTQLWVEFETDYSVYEQWISVLLNGAHVARMMLPKGRGWVQLMHGLDAAQINHIEILRDVQAMPNDDDCSLRIHALRTDGAFLPVEAKKLKLEVIGDSITSSEGAIGAQEETNWMPVLFCAARGYAHLAAAQLQADLRVISQSGWGVLTSWDNDPSCAIPTYYDQVCGVIKGEKNAALGAFEKNDFDAWSADVVVINLGTNDSSAFSQPAFTDPVTGVSYKQRSNEDGTRNREDEQKLCAAMRGFLATVRKCNPNAYILWAYGMLGAPIAQLIKGAVAQYCNESGDQRAQFMLLPDGPADGIGARNHPGLLMHMNTASVLAEKIRSL